MANKLWQTKKRRRLQRRACIFAFIIILVALLSFVQIQIQPIIHTIASQKAHLEVIHIINEAVDEQMGQGIGYRQLVNVVTNEDGTVSYIQPDTLKITRLTTAIAADIEMQINDLEEQGIDFPIGLLTGYVLLSDKGPNFHVDIKPTGDVAVDISDEFTEAGINQTKHRVVLNVSAELGILIPFSADLVQVTNSFPLAESIIVGPIPDTYLNFDNQNAGDSSFLNNNLPKDGYDIEQQDTDKTE